MKSLYQKTFDQVCMPEEQKRSLREKLTVHCEGCTEKRDTRALVCKRIMQSAVGITALAVCFVLVVNFYTPIALACGKVPVLRELAQAVIVSPSLSAAVANEHVQLIAQEQTVNGYTVRLEYVIADKRQVNVFCTVEGKIPYGASGGRYHVYAYVTSADAPPHNTSGYLAKPGEMDYITIDFVDQQTPEHLDLAVVVYQAGASEEQARCEFSLELDPDQVNKGRTVELNQDFVLEGNIFTLSTAELYPTHIRLNIEQDEGNSAYLHSLSVSIDGDGKSEREIHSEVLSDSGGGKFGTYSIHSSSLWYYDCDELTLTIKGAVWLNKERIRAVVDLTDGTAAGLPDGVEFRGIVDKRGEKALSFYSTGRWDIASSPFYMECRDENGEVFKFSGLSHTTAGGGGSANLFYYFEEYQGETVVLENKYSHVAKYDEPLVLTVDVRE